MAADGGRKAPLVIEQLFDPIQGRLFDFFQAVALLEGLARRVDECVAGLADSGEPGREAVRFASSVRLSFPTSDIVQTARARDPEEGDGRDPAGQKPTMTVNFMGLAGALGPLPAPFAEIIVRRTALGDTASRDFLDIFNHRLLSLVYRIRKRHRIALGVTRPVDDDAVRHLFALVGLGEQAAGGGLAPRAHAGSRVRRRAAPPLRDRLAPVEDRSLLYYAGLFAREVRPLCGLVAVLRCHFGLPFDAEPLVGGFYPIEPSHRTTIGPSGKNRRLGDDAVLGCRYWDPAACVEIRVGPLDATDYVRFLPGGDGVAEGDCLAPLYTLVRFYAGEAVDVRVRLVLDPAAARGDRRRRRAAAPPRTQRLGERPRLGYTAWVGRSFEQREVVLGAAARAAREER